MINIPKIDNLALKNLAAKQVYSKQIVLQNNDKAINSNNSNYIAKDFSFKILACQVKAMAEQDNKNPVGRKFNIYA